MNIYIGFTLSPKSHAMSRLVAVLNYLSGRKVEMISLPSHQFINHWENLINQVNHEVGKKHHRQTAYNNLNVLILKIIIPCIYLVKHLLQKFINRVFSITRVSKGSNHSMNNVPYAHVTIALNRLQMLLILHGSTK